MSKKIATLLFIIISLSTYSSADDLLKKISPSNKDKQQNIVNEDYRFDYSDSDLKLKRYKAVLKKGSLIKSLKTKKVEKVKRGVLVEVRDVSLGSSFAVIFDKFDTPIYLCETKNLKKLGGLTRLTPKYHGYFNKEEIKYNATDLKKIINLRPMFYGASYSLKDFEASSASAIGVTAEFSFKDDSQYPISLYTDFNQLSSQNIDWNMVNIGFKIGKKLEKTELRIGAETTLFGRANFLEGSQNIRSNKFMIGIQYPKELFIFELETGVTKLNYSSDTNFTESGIIDGESLSPFIGLKIGMNFNLGFL